MSEQETSGFQFPTLEYTKDWNVRDPESSKYIPTYSADETEVRAMMQVGLDNLKDTWNGDLKEAFEAYTDSLSELTPEGPWDAESTYAKLALVYYGGKTYICKEAVESPSNTPPSEDSTHWALYSDHQDLLEVVADSPSVKQAGESAALTVTTTDGVAKVKLEGVERLPMLSSATRSKLKLSSGATVDQAIQKLGNYFYWVEASAGGSDGITFSAPAGSRILFAAYLGTYGTGNVLTGFAIYPRQKDSANGQIEWSNDGSTVTLKRATSSSYTFSCVALCVPK